jgi:hypothetical protein
MQLVATAVVVSAMRVLRSRPCAALLAAGTLALTAIPVARAETSYDPSFGVDGSIMLAQLRGVAGQVTQTCEVGGGRLLVAGRFGPNATGRPVPWRVGQQLATTAISLRPAQRLSNGTATVAWRRQKVPAGELVVTQDFDNRGGFAYVTRSTRPSRRTKLRIFRIRGDGHRDVTFGRRGVVELTLAGLTAARPPLRVTALPGGKVQLLAQTADRLSVLRITGRGTPDTAWGVKGVVELPAVRRTGFAPLDPLEAATPTPDGGLLLAAAGLPGTPATGGALGVLRLDPKGVVLSGWADHGFWRPPAAGAPVGVRAGYDSTGQTLLTAIRHGGDFAVLWADSAATPDGGDSDLKLAHVDARSGVTTLFNSDAGLWSLGGDDSHPDAAPWLLRASPAGVVEAHAQSSYAGLGAVLSGRAARYSDDALLPQRRLALHDPGFTAEAFAIDPRSARRLYICGSLGTTGDAARNPADRNQRRVVAVRRVRL